MNDIVNVRLRDHNRYSGDGLPYEPVGAPLPIGDPSSGVFHPLKADLRAAMTETIDSSALSAAQAALYIQIWIDTAAAFEGSALTYAAGAGQVAAGNIIGSKADNFRWQVLAAGAAVFDRINGNGVKVLALPLAVGVYAVEAITPWTVPNTGQNNVIAHANRNGGLALGNGSLSYVYTAKTYDLRSGPRTALLVNNVKFISSINSALNLRDVPFVLLGSAAGMIESVWVTGFAPEAYEVPIRQKRTVNGATQANPVVVTSVGHGYLTGEKVRLLDVGGMTQIDDIPFTITVINTDSFSLNGINGTAYGAYSGGGELRPESDAALVKIVNASRVFIRDTIPRRIPHIVKVDALPGGITTDIVISGVTRIYGHESYDWVALHTRLAAGAAGLFIDGAGGFPSNVATNPAILPKLMSGATQANPVVISCTGHGFATGDRIRMCAVGGMTQIDSTDFTITVINANSFSLNGINGTGYSAYTSGGWAVELHSSQPFDTGVVFINGKWDTAEMHGVLAQHFAWMWRVRATETISFVWEKGCTFDYGGKGRYQVVLAGGSVTNINAEGGWHFALDEDFLSISKPNVALPGVVDQVKIDGMVIGLSGGNIFRDTFNNAKDVTFSNVQIGGVGRARKFLAFSFLPNASTNLRLVNITSTDPAGSYGAGANTFLVPDYGFYNDSSLVNTQFTVTGCELAGSVAAFSVPLVLTAAGPRKRIVLGNKKLDGTLPEYVVTQGAAMPGTGVVQVNTTGLIMEVHLSGGTITSVSKNGVVIRSGAGAFSFTVGRGESWACAYSVAPTLIYSFRD